MITSQMWMVLFLIDAVVVSLIGIYAFVAYYRKLNNLKKIESDAYNKYGKIIEEANTKAKEILDKVERKADEILTHSELFKNDMDSTIKTALKESNQKYMKTLDEYSNKFIADYENLLTTVKNQSLNKAQQSLDNVENEVKKSIAISMAGLNNEIMKSINKALEEIEEYKKKEMTKVDEKIDQVVVQMAKDLLRMNLSVKDHKKLVINALDKAKEQGLFFL